MSVAKRSFARAQLGSLNGFDITSQKCERITPSLSRADPKSESLAIAIALHFPGSVWVNTLVEQDFGDFNELPSQCEFRHQHFLGTIVRSFKCRLGEILSPDQTECV